MTFDTLTASLIKTANDADEDDHLAKARGLAMAAENELAKAKHEGEADEEKSLNDLMKEYEELESNSIHD